jgi:hypothetical protein
MTLFFQVMVALVHSRHTSPAAGDVIQRGLNHGQSNPDSLHTCCHSSTQIVQGERLHLLNLVIVRF